MSTADGSKQIVLALNVYDLAAELHGGRRVPKPPLLAVKAALC
ncbi:MAG TPA: hypothetical protein VFG15_33425 [Amycolatopsis sp.]|nr:hypothetical protein [Amycolatopsis sp.]